MIASLVWLCMRSFATADTWWAWFRLNALSLCTAAVSSIVLMIIVAWFGVALAMRPSVL